MSLQPNFEVLWIEQVLKKPSKTNASKHSIHFPPFQGHKKSIRNSLFSNSLSKMLHFFSMKFATTLDFTGFPVISHLFTDGLTLECPFVRYSVKLHYSLCKKDSQSFDPAAPNTDPSYLHLFRFYRFTSSSVISSQVTPFSAINTIIWYRKSEISYFTSSGSGFLAAITISVASSPTFFKILSIPLSKR